MFFIIIIAVFAFLILLAAIVTGIILMKRKRSGKTLNRSESAKVGVVMSAQIIQGNCLTGNLDMRLRDELIIGSDKSCDLVFDDPYIAPRNSRIFIKEGAIYIEDLKEMSNTYLESMKIFKPNRLRSGDEISIGKTTFKLLF